MTVAGTRVARKYINVVAGTPITGVDIQLYAQDELDVHYGIAALLAVLNVDYTLTLAADFTTFDITPTASLIAKIDALIAADPDEMNYITVRRNSDVTTSSTPAAVRQTKFQSDENDRGVMRDQETAEKLNRAVILAPSFEGDTPKLQLNTLVPDTVLVVNSAGDAIEAGPTAAAIEGAETDAVAAAASAASAAASAASAAASAASLPNYKLDMAGANTVGGTSDAIEVTTAQTVSAYVDGLEVSFIAGADNPGAVTLDLDGIGAKSLEKINGVGVEALDAKDLLSGGIYSARYQSSSDKFILRNPEGVADNSITNDRFTAAHSLALSHTVADRTALKALDTARYNVAFNKDTNQMWVYRLGDYSSEVTADIEEGKYAKANGIATIVGAWVAVVKGKVNVKDFGAVGGGVVDDTAAFTAALAVSDIFVPNDVYLIDPSVGVIISRSGTTIIGESKRNTILLAKYNTAGSVIKREFDTGGANDRIDDVTISGIAVFLNHIHQSAVPANTQIAFDIRNISRTDIRNCYAGNYRYGEAETLYPNAVDNTQAMRGYGFVYGNVAASDPAYAGGEVHLNIGCKGWWLRKSHSIDDATLSPNSAAYKTHIMDADIQTVERAISQESQYNTGCSYRDNLIQDIKQAASGTDTRHAYYIGGYENLVDGGYHEVTDANIDQLVYLASTARNNDVTIGYHDVKVSKILSDNGSRNLVKYFYRREVTITGATQANPCVITAAGHNLRNGESLQFSDVAGMTELNGNIYTISNLTATTFELNVDSSAFTAYTSGGVASVIDKTLACFYYNAPLEASVKFNWDGAAILATGDLASKANITRNGTGDYTITFDKAYALDGYDISVQLDTNASGHMGAATIGSHGPTNCRLYTYAQNGASSTLIDPRNVWLTIRQIAN